MRSRLILGIAVIGVAAATGGLLWMLRTGDEHPRAVHVEPTVAVAAPEPTLAPPPPAPKPQPAPVAEAAPPEIPAAPAPADAAAAPMAPGIDPQRVWMDGVIERFERGQEAYRDGRWAEAAEMALALYDDVGGAQNLYYAAECYQRLGDTARADELRARYAEELRAEQQAAPPPVQPQPQP